MKIKLLLLMLIVVIFTACQSTTGKVGNIDPNDITYFEDPRTGICYAIIGAREGDSFNESTSIGLTIVPCEKVKKYLKK